MGASLPSPAASSWLAARLSSAGQDSRSSFYTVATRLISMLHLDRCHVEQHVALSHLTSGGVACDLGRGWERASDRVACQASRRAEPACVCLPRERVPCGVHACRARRWCAAAPATTDRNARAGPCRMLGPGAQRRPPVIVYTCFEKSSRSPYCTREPRRRAHCVILIYIITRLLRIPLCRPPGRTLCTQ